MKTRCALAVVAMASTLPIAFWLYGAARTMCETVGFNTRSLVVGAMFGFVAPLLVVLSILFALRMARASARPITLTGIASGACLGLLAGSLLSESWILADERSFDSEVRHAVPLSPYGRARAWPNETCSLVYIPGKVVHATD